MGLLVTALMEESHFRDSCKLVNCNACILGHRGTNFTSILNIKVYLQPNISTVKSQDEDISEVKTLTGLQIWPYLFAAVKTFGLF